ncbi:MAG: histidine phosphatase family protein [Aestuariivirgaceae bacterium]
MRILHFIRHGPVVVDFDQHSADWKLAPSAEKPVAALAGGLRQVAPTRLVSSNHKKTVETANILSNALNVPVEVRPGLEEHHRDTEHFVRSGEDFEQTMSEFFARPDDIVFGLESAAMALRRFHKAVCEVMAETDNDEVIVTHGAVMALLLAQSGNGSALSIWKDLKQPDHLKVEWPELRCKSRVTT